MHAWEGHCRSFYLTLYGTFATIYYSFTTTIPAFLSLAIYRLDYSHIDIDGIYMEGAIGGSLEPAWVHIYERRLEHYLEQIFIFLLPASYATWNILGLFSSATWRTQVYRSLISCWRLGCWAVPTLSSLPPACTYTSACLPAIYTLPAGMPATVHIGLF